MADSEKGETKPLLQGSSDAEGWTLRNYLILSVLLAGSVVTQALRFVFNFIYLKVPEGDKSPDSVARDPDINLAVGLNINPTEYGFLAGVGFSLIILALSLPIARLADSGSVGKKLVVACGLLTQAVFTALESTAWNFTSIMFFRFGLAAGQACMTAPSVAMIGSSFASSSKATANSIFSIGVYLGGGAAALSGSLAILVGWRMTFLILAGITLVVAISAFFTLPDDRSEKDGEQSEGDNEAKPLTVFDTEAAAIWFSSTSSAMLLTAGCLRYFAGFTTAAFLPVYLQHEYGVDKNESTKITTIYGLVTIVAGSTSVLSGGVLSDYLLKNGNPTAPALVAGIGSLLAVPMLLIMLYWADSAETALATLFFLYLVAECWAGPAHSVAQALAPKESSTQALSVYFAIMTVFGTLGPLLVGFAEQHNWLPLKDLVAFGLGIPFLLSGIVLLSMSFVCPEGWGIKAKSEA